MSNAKDVDFERLVVTKRGLEREVKYLKEEKHQASMKIEKLEREMSNAEERGETSSSRLIKESVDWQMKAFNLEGQIKFMKTSEEYNKLGEKNFHLEYRMKQMKTPEEYKECESQIHQLEKDQLTMKFEVKELEERIKGMKTRDECDSLMKEKDAEKLEMEKKIEKLREEIQGMKTKDEYDVLVKEKDAEKLELEKKIEKLQEDLSVFGHGNGHNIQQSPQHFGMGPQSPYGDHMGIQQSPSPRTPGFQPPFQGFSTHGSPQHGPSGSFSQSPQPGLFGTSSQFLCIHRPGFDAGSPMHPATGFSSGPQVHPSTGSGPPMHPSVGMGFGVGPSPPPGLNYPPGFQQSNPPPGQGQFGQFQLDRNFPPLNQAPPQFGLQGPAPGMVPPVPRNFRFLVSGGVEGGVLTLNVPAGLIQKMNEQIDEWIEAKKPPKWYQATTASSTRCVEVRSRSLGLVRGPPTSDVGDKFACIHCMDRGLLCVLVGRDGPVIAPLNLRERLPGATPQSPGYYIR
ncbi:hypothetical protein BOTNAR_1063g00020 [Botryotinia narcissicola]|uniref:Uncharacterized protein n=1 Tax=Botryotinia narcissicola TaxID=278944 RepID=A0A4Z1HB29_9HELO|nr:hypothetical protein BOTNAR_1063g00020 [Botryotinia narcissicola]